MAKKIKSFTVDEDVYNRLVAMFKKHKAETSISMYLNNELRSLLEYFDSIEEGLKGMKMSIPMSFVIDSTIEGSERSGKISDERNEDCPISDLDNILVEIRDDYEAYKMGIPRQFYDFLKLSQFSLSNDKQFLIDKETGKKYMANNKGGLMEVRDVETDELIKSKKKKK